MSGRSRFEPLLHVVRRLGDQLLENVPGDVLTQAELLGENGIALGPLDHVQKAEIREARAIVVGDRVHDFLVAARHQHVGDRLLDRFAFRDREQMRLAFGADVGDQGVGLEPLGLLQDRAGDFDRIVKGEFVDDIDRGAGRSGPAAWQAARGPRPRSRPPAARSPRQRSRSRRRCSGRRSSDRWYATTPARGFRRFPARPPRRDPGETNFTSLILAA